MTSFRTLLAGRARVAALVVGALVAGALGYALALSGGTAATASPSLSADNALTAALTASSSGSGLRADLAAARAKTGAARVAALGQIRAEALAGGYGDAVKRAAERRGIKRELILSLLPANLQADLANLRSAPAGQRKALRQQILTKAVAGDYGPQVQTAAERLKALRSNA
ncbi:MAG: hypothetical protein JWR52_1411 [Marmoricola sp.]|nr:hypothetical protein [Marmoricola sp.]